MQKELSGKAEQWSSHSFETIYFGGGTPSLLSPMELEELLSTIHQRYTIGPNAEITLEANPDDISEASLTQWKQLGINRLSIGIQSFANTDLEWMNRAHNAEQATQALRGALEYFPNLTADLIYGTPGLTDAQWIQNIETLTQLQVPHISAYALTVEPKTPLDKQIRLQQKPATDSEQQARQFLIGMDKLRNAGYEHYEISNFAKPGHHSKHNSSYWKGIPYLGIGPSAHSYQPPIRSWQVANNPQYIERIETGLFDFESETLTPIQQLNERIMIALRTQEGLSVNEIAPTILDSWKPMLNRYEQEKLMLIENGSIRLTDFGKLQADGIAAALFLEEGDQMS